MLPPVSDEEVLHPVAKSEVVALDSIDSGHRDPQDVLSALLMIVRRN
jgi:hypothetical protein